MGKSENWPVFAPYGQQDLLAWFGDQLFVCFGVKAPCVEITDIVQCFWWWLKGVITKEKVILVLYVRIGEKLNQQISRIIAYKLRPDRKSVV